MTRPSPLAADLLAGRYRFQPTRLVRRPEEALEVWEALDALVLKAISLVLTEQLGPRLSPRCFHLAGRGGAKAAVRAALASMDKHGFVFRTGVKSYYASIDHDVLLGLLGQEIQDRRVLDLVAFALRRTREEDGLYTSVTRGISLGCALSPPSHARM